MARQTSIITLNGKVGGISFYKTKDGYFAREKGGVSKSRIMTDPRFARTRENLQEFTENAKSVKLLLDTMRPATIRLADPKLNQRMFKQMMQVLRTDPVNARGERKVWEGDWDLLRGMELNIRSGLTSTLRAEYSVTNTAAEWGVTINSFLPADFLMVPDGATHFRLFIAGIAVDFQTGDRSFQMEATAELPANSPSGNIALMIQKSGLPESQRIFLLGVEFLQMVNGQHYSINNGANNAAALITTEKV